MIYHLPRKPPSSAFVSGTKYVQCKYKDADGAQCKNVLTLTVSRAPKYCKEHQRANRLRNQRRVYAKKKKQQQATK